MKTTAIIVAALAGCAAAAGQPVPGGPQKPPAVKPLNQEPEPPSALRPTAKPDDLPAGLPESPFTEMSAADAVAKAKREYKVLIIIDSSREGSPPQGRRTWHENLAMRAWIHWHAIMIRVDRETANLVVGTWQRQRCPAGSPPFQNEYGMAIVIDGRIECNLPFVRPDAAIGALLPGAGNGGGVGFPTGIGALFAVNFVLECAEARMPMWGERHRKANPPPPPPDMAPPLHARDDGEVEAITDPPIGGRDLTVVLDRLREARNREQIGDRFRAGGLLTWLWERGTAMDEDFADARLLALPPLMKDVSHHSGAKGRFSILAERSVASLPWADHDGWYTFIALCRASNQPLREIEVLDEIVNDIDNAAMTPVADQSIMKLVMAAVELPGKPLDEAMAWVKRQHSALGKGRPRAVHADDFKRLDEARRWAVVHAGAGVFSRLAEAGRKDDALAVLELCREVQTKDPARRFIVTAAAQGNAKPWMRALLVKDDVLLGYVPVE